jgi:glycosyltransferase involved in cell wall biosynthesis
MRGRPLRIAVVSEHASPLAVLGGVDSGGQNVLVSQLSRHLAELGAEVTIHTRRDDPSLPEVAPLARGVLVHHVDAGPAEPLARDELLPWMGAFADELELAWREQRPDVVHAHYWMSGVAATRAARPLGLPVALTLHALGLVKERAPGAIDTSPPERVATELALASTVDLLIATAADELRELVGAGATPRQAVVVPCGVDLDVFHPATADEVPDPLVPPRRPGRHRLVTLGRLVERKGIADVISALAELPDAELVVVGGTPGGLLDDDPLAQQLVAHARALGVEDRVELLGAVPTPSVPRVLRSADVLCHYPWYEAFGIAALEAMACGVPVVASATGGLPSTVEHGVTGVLVAPRHPETLAATLRGLLDDPQRRAEMGRQGALRAVHFSWRAIAARIYGQLDALARSADELTRRDGTSGSVPAP